MPFDTPEAGSAPDWLRHGHSDLALSQMRKTKKLLYEHLCFHAQQAAEKAVKAVLIHHGIHVPRSHDLAYLVSLLPASVSIPPALVELPTLTKYAVQQRYPGDVPPLTVKHRRRAVQLANDTVTWAARAVCPEPRH